MQRLGYLFLLLAIQPAFAGSFEDRVKRAKAVEETEAYKRYQGPMFKSIGDDMAYTMRSCFETIKNPDTRSFVVVADILHTGNATMIEVQPSTNVSMCFANGFSNLRFPTPPRLEDRFPFSITIEMGISE